MWPENNTRNGHAGVEEKCSSHKPDWSQRLSTLRIGTRRARSCKKNYSSYHEKNSSFLSTLTTADPFHGMKSTVPVCVEHVKGHGSTRPGRMEIRFFWTEVLVRRGEWYVDGTGSIVSRKWSPRIIFFQFQLLLLRLYSRKNPLSLFMRLTVMVRLKVRLSSNHLSFSNPLIRSCWMTSELSWMRSGKLERRIDR